jgi:uncharacterized SAM-binding protein YcdF (DUF218 family)
VEKVHVMDKVLQRARESVQHQGSGQARAGRMIARLSAITFCAALTTFTVGFFAFVSGLERKESTALTKADAIVALTGGAERITDAVERLAHGSGGRLLISGVSAGVSVQQMLPNAPGLKTWLRCCIDLDHQARNTVGNAEETRRWANAHGYRSLVVVTSSYHMPRAMLELRRHMPDMTFIAAPVVTQRLQGLDYWTDLQLLKTLGQEYAKFLVAYARSRLTSPASSDEITATTPRQRA